MARGNDPGKDFDDQWNDSFREAQKKAQRGEGPWAEDKYLARRQEQSGPPARQRCPAGSEQPRPDQDRACRSR